MTEQEVLAYLYRKRDGALSGATRVVYAEAISAIEGDLFGDPNETPTPRRFDDRAVLCDRDASATDHRGRSSGSELRAAVRDRRHLATARRPSADRSEGLPDVSGAVAELLLKGASDEQIAEVEALRRTFLERRRTHPSPLHSDGGQAACATSVIARSAASGATVREPTARIADTARVRAAIRSACVSTTDRTRATTSSRDTTAPVSISLQPPVIGSSRHREAPYGH
jgi:hypothetical protein